MYKGGRECCVYYERKAKGGDNTVLDDKGKADGGDKRRVEMILC